jgi:hypothetical protein
MKRPSPSLLIAASTAALLALPMPALLQAQQAPAAAPIDAEAVISTLKELRAKQAQTIKNAKSQVLASLNATMAADPVKAFEQAVVTVEFQNQGGADGSRLADWRKKNGDVLRNRDFASAVRMHLLYLSLTWQRSMGATPKEQLPALIEYTAQVENNRDTFAPFENLLKRSLNESVFTAYYQIGPYISGLPEWEMQPFNAEGIYQKSILPELRRQKDPRVLDYWDKRIRGETVRAEKSQNSLTINKFNRIRRPTLLWGRAEEQLRMGDKAHAVNEMLTIVKTYSDHPDFDKWAKRLEAIVDGDGSGDAAPDDKDS